MRRSAEGPWAPSCMDIPDRDGSDRRQMPARGMAVSHETVRQLALKFGQGFANEIRRRLPRPGDKWHLDEVEIKIAGQKHWVWRAVDREGIVLDVLVQSRRDKRAAKRL